MRSNFCLSCAAILAVSIASGIPQAYAADPAVKCEASKLKESAKYGNCRLKAESKAVKKGLPADFTKCETKFTEKFNKAESKAGLGICPSEADEPAINGRITVHAAEIATLLAGGVLPACGDAIVDPGEQCDGTDLAGADCTELGFAGGALACDASCFFDLSACTGNPPPSLCGDGAVDAGEDCDFGDLNGEDCFTLGFNGGGQLECAAFCNFDTSACTVIPKIAFVTSSTTQGGFGSLANADAACQLSANAAGLSGIYKAWLSDSTGSPVTRFNQASVPYVRTDGVRIANDWADLVDGSLQAPIDRDEFGNQAVIVIAVWTGTTTGGNATGVDCGGWTVADTSLVGDWGGLTSTGSTWSVVGLSPHTCERVQRFYCFEQ